MDGMPATIVATTDACAATNEPWAPNASAPYAVSRMNMTATATNAPMTLPIAWAIHCARQSVPRMWPALKSYMTSPARPHATAMTPAT